MYAQKYIEENNHISEYAKLYLKFENEEEFNKIAFDFTEIK